MTSSPEDHEQPTQAVTPDAAAEQFPDDDHQGDAAMTDPAQAIASEFDPSDGQH